MSEGGTETAAAIAGAVELVKMGSDNERLRKAGDNLAFVGEVITGLVKTALMPLAVVNARAEAYFGSKFPEQLAEKMKDVPPEDITSPKPSIAGPVLQGLGYSHEENNLRELYLALLSTAMDGRIATSAHPGFAEIIGALSADEVPFLNVFLKAEASASVELRLGVEGGEGFNVAYRHLVRVVTMSQPQSPVVNEMLPAYIDNWIRLGLVEADYTSYLTSDNAYAWVETRPEFLAIREASPTRPLTHERGIIRPTAFGGKFAEAVGIR